MKRWALFAPVLAVGLLLGPVAPSRAADFRRIALQPVQDAAACRAAVAAHPVFAGTDALQAFTAAGGPCAIDTSASASSAARTMTCAITLDHLEEHLLLLNDWVSETFSFGCTGGVGTPEMACFNVTTIADAVPTVMPGADAGSGACEGRSLIQETPAALHVPAVQVGLVVGVDLAGDVGVAPGLKTWST
jgi:hypothetical protein